MFLLLFACAGKNPGDSQESAGSDLDESAVAGVDADEDGWAVGDDCDDGDASTHPNAPEYCDGIDNNCDGNVDELANKVYYVDADLDGWGDPWTGAAGCVPEGAFAGRAGDCDDTDQTINPDAAETCDLVDNDCDGGIDEGVEPQVYYRDQDGDSYGVTTDVVIECSAPSGYVDRIGDCDDTDNDVNPDEREVCDLVDNDCDGDVDEGVEASVWFYDSDGDGYGTGSTYVVACNDPGGYADNGEDCDDGNVTIFPGAVEVCDGRDNDCDGEDDEGATGATTWYYDADDDGYGAEGGATSVDCEQPAGFVTDHSDCDDYRSETHPGADEVCDSLDNDCNGTVDDDPVETPVYRVDADGDGFGDPTLPGVYTCDAGAGYVLDDSDCDDTIAAVNPAAAEVCNRVDDNCDGEIDGTGLDGTWYLDRDGDGYGDPYAWEVTCDPEGGYVLDGTDCDDADPDVHPGADDVTGDGIDTDCSGSLEYDADGDGYEGEAWGGADCDDAREDVNPGAPEVYYDGFDQDCSGGSDYDADEDGFVSEAYGGDDCNDADATMYPGAPETSTVDDHDCDGLYEYGPTADASYDRSSAAESCATLTLDGSRSADRESTTLSYDWQVTLAPYGSAVTTTALVEESDESPTVFLDLAGDYRFTLQVTDEDGNLSAVDTLDLEAQPRTVNQAPVAAGGADQSSSSSVDCRPIAYGTGGYECGDCPTTTFTLDGSGSYDGDGEPIAYQWSVYSGDGVLLSDPTSTSATVQVTAPAAGYGTANVEEVVVRLEITDCFGAVSAPDPVVLSYGCLGY